VRLQNGQATPSRTVRILLIEDHQLVAEGLQLLLDREPDFEVVGIAANGAEALRQARDLEPDVLLVDFRLPDATGAEIAASIRRQLPRVVTIFLSMVINPVLLLDAVRAGARAYLLKSQAGSELVNTVRRALAGEMLIPASVLAELVANQGERAQLVEKLTPREKELLALVAEGLDNWTIADRLGITYATVRGHLRNLLGKLDAHSKLEAVVRASELGLIER
jgi:two-component system, NarL family, nitrate/nitrite response regulator NarL